MKVIGDLEKAHQRIILLAAKNSGESGISLGDLRRFVPDPNHLNGARHHLLGAEDKTGKKTQDVLIQEKRGENNEIRVFMVKS